MTIEADFYDTSRKPWVVTDLRNIRPGFRYPTLGRFATQEQAASFISTLPDHLTGCYGLDGPDACVRNGPALT